MHIKCYYSKNKSLFIATLIVTMLICIFLFAEKCNAAENDSGSDATDEVIDSYDYSDIDGFLKNNTEYDISFKKIISNVISDNENFSGVSGYIKMIADMINANKKAFMEILMLGLLSALLKSFGDGFSSKQLSDTSQMIISLTMLTLLTAVFAGAVKTTENIIEVIIQFYQAVCPVFFPAVIATGGSVSAASYYQIVTMMIAAVNIVFKNILLKINNIYMLLGVADSITEEDHFTKACEIAQTIIKYVSKTVLVIFLGLNGIKGMVVPYSDALTSNVLLKTLSIIPGVGNTAATVSKTIIGAGTIVKNSIGVAAIIVIIMLTITPILKLVVLAFLYKAVAAVLEPIAGKNIVNGISCVSNAIGNMIRILLTSVSLLIMTMGIICLTTNVNYLA